MGDGGSGWEWVPSTPFLHPHPAAWGVRAGQMLGRAATGTSTSLGLGVQARLNPGCSGHSIAHETRAGQGSCSTGSREHGVLRTWLSTLQMLVPQAARRQTCAENSSSQPARSTSSPCGCTTMGVR